MKKIVVTRNRYYKNKYLVTLLDYTGEIPSSTQLKTFTDRQSAMEYKKKKEEELGLE